MRILSAITLATTVLSFAACAAEEVDAPISMNDLAANAPWIAESFEVGLEDDAPEGFWKLAPGGGGGTVGGGGGGPNCTACANDAACDGSDLHACQRLDGICSTNTHCQYWCDMTVQYCATR